MTKVSIVVPVYNVEKYLDRCIESLVKQTLNEIEIILVDDGSQDNSGEICDRWEKTDSRIRTIHKTNGGLSSARNAGLERATGTYIGFVDSDDDVEMTMFEELYNTASKHQVDFVMCDYQRILEDGSTYLKTLNIRNGLYSKNNIKEDIFPRLIMDENVDYGPLLSVWHCLYSIEFLKKNQITFDEEVRWSEDNIFSAYVGYCADSFYYMKGKALYHYWQNEGSITTSYRSGAWKVYCTMNQHLREYFKDINKTSYDFSRQLDIHLIYYACHTSRMAMKKSSNKERYDEIKGILNTNQLKDAMKMTPLPGDSIKLKAQLLLMKYRCVRLLMLLYQKGI